MNVFYPEGRLITSEENSCVISSPALMKQAGVHKTVLEARAAVCTPAHDLWLDIPFAKAVIPRTEGALGIADGTARDISMLSRVGKPVAFTVMSVDDSGETPVYTLSRADAQRRCMEGYISQLRCGDVIPATVTHLEPFGAFVDIGCGISSLIPIDSISVSRISHPNDRFYNGQQIFAAVKSRNGGRICLSHKELLGTWAENAARFEVGSTVRGTVRSVESYGVFIELAPNLAGLSEPREGLLPGMNVSVNIKAVKPEKMKVKLTVVDILEPSLPAPPYTYYIRSGHIDRWQYSPEGSSKSIFTDFTENSGTDG